MSEVHPKRRARLTAVAVAAVLSGGLVWYSTGLRGDRQTPSNPGASVTSPKVGKTAQAAAAGPTVPATGASQTSHRHGPDEMQVCSGAWLKTDSEGSIDQASYDRAIGLREVRGAIVSKLLASADDVSRIAGLLVATIDRGEPHRAALLGLPASCEGAECAAAQAAAADVAKVRETIARMALASNVPEVYALALKVCSASREGGCQLLNARQLARLDPGNAAPWLQVMQDASASKDAVAQLEALHQIASARRNDANAFALTGAVLKAAPDDDRAADAVFLTATAAFGFETVSISSGYQPLLALCSSQAVRDANRAQTCGRVAETLAERSDTVLGRNIGGSLGKRLGWPTERSDRMRGEFNAYTESRTSQWLGSGTEFGCAVTKRGVDQLRKTAALGEVGAMREWVVASGKRPEDFIREERARQQQAARAAEEAAASAAAASAAR